MALDLREPNLLLEIEFAEQEREKRLASYKSILEGYTSPFHSAEVGELSDTRENYNPENQTYELVSNLVPKMVFTNPRVRVKTRRIGEHEGIAVAGQYATNRWIRDNRLAEFLDGPAHDVLFNFSVVMVDKVDNPTVYGPRQGTIPQWPQLTRISQHNFILDPAAYTTTEARYMGHKWVIDKEDLLQIARENKDDGWLVEGIEATAPSSYSDDDVRRRSLDSMPDRKVIECVDLWIPEYEEDDHPGPEKGFHGTIVSLAIGKSSGGGAHAHFIRKPRPFEGPRWGPYHICWIHVVPDDPFGLSPTVAVEGQVRDLNKQARAAADQAAKYKRIVVISDTDDNLGEHIREGVDTGVLQTAAGFSRDSVVEIEVGGVTQHNLAYLQLSKDRVDRVSGLTEIQKGSLSSNATATEVAIADAASDVRADYVKLKFHRHVRRILESVLWYIVTNKDVALALDPDSIRALEESGAQVEMPADGGQLVWTGGDLDPAPGRGFDDLELEIEPMSMERVSESVAQRRAVALFELVTQLSQVIPMSADFIKWDKVLNRMGDALNIPDLADLVDIDAAAAYGEELRQMQAESLKAPAQGSPKPTIMRPPPNKTQPPVKPIGNAAGSAARQKAMGPPQ